MFLTSRVGRRFRLTEMLPAVWRALARASSSPPLIACAEWAMAVLTIQYRVLAFHNGILESRLTARHQVMRCHLTVPCPAPSRHSARRRAAILIPVPAPLP